MLGTLIKSYCKDNDISQEKFGELIGVGARYVRYFVAGRKPTVEVAERIKKLTGWSLDEIYSRE